MLQTKDTRGFFHDVHIARGRREQGAQALNQLKIGLGRGVGIRLQICGQQRHGRQLLLLPLQPYREARLRRGPGRHATTWQHRNAQRTNFARDQRLDLLREARKYLALLLKGDARRLALHLQAA